MCFRYRFIIPIFLHSGIIHYIVNMYLQLGLGAQIERTTGTLRMGLIYMTSGIGGCVNHPPH
jgi:membrane associated rhomboid family serine protease